MLKAPLTKPGKAPINSLSRQRGALEAFLRACLGLESSGHFRHAKKRKYVTRDGGRAATKPNEIAAGGGIKKGAGFFCIVLKLPQKFRHGAAVQQDYKACDQYAPFSGYAEEAGTF
jgi:hypothetical protein